jgi:phosphatidylglycerophosphate synthase
VSRSATLYLASPEDLGPALATLAGRPVAFRAVLAAVRAGCATVYVPAVFRHSPLERAVAASPSARAAVRWLEAGAVPPTEPMLMLPAAAVIPASGLRDLFAARPTTVLATSRDSGMPAVVADPSLTRALWPSLVAARPLGDTLLRALKDDPRAAVLDTGWCVRITSSRGLAEAAERLDSDLGSPVDTRLDVLFHRRLSRPLSRLAVRWGISPNVVTVLSFAVGLAAVWCFWHATPVWALLGLALYAGAVILDHADGEVARLTLTESSFGATFDVVVDTIIHALLVIAIGDTAQEVAGGGAALIGYVAALGVVASALMTRTSPPATGSLGSLLNALGNRDGFYAMLALFIAALAVLPAALPVLMLVVAAGSHAFWLGRLVVGYLRPKTERKPK